MTTASEASGTNLDLSSEDSCFRIAKCMFVSVSGLLPPSVSLALYVSTNWPSSFEVGPVFHDFGNVILRDLCRSVDSLSS